MSSCAQVSSQRTAPKRPKWVCELENGCRTVPEWLGRIVRGGEAHSTGAATWVSRRPGGWSVAEVEEARERLRTALPDFELASMQRDGGDGASEREVQISSPSAESYADLISAHITKMGTLASAPPGVTLPCLIRDLPPDEGWEVYLDEEGRVTEVRYTGTQVATQFLHDHLSQEPFHMLALGMGHNTEQAAFFAHICMNDQLVSGLVYDPLSPPTYTDALGAFCPDCVALATSQEEVMEWVSDASRRSDRLVVYAPQASFAALEALFAQLFHPPAHLRGRRHSGDGPACPEPCPPPGPARPFSDPGCASPALARGPSHDRAAREVMLLNLSHHMMQTMMAEGDFHRLPNLAEATARGIPLGPVEHSATFVHLSPELSGAMLCLV